jgi:hypothetical protein
MIIFQDNFQIFIVLHFLVQNSGFWYEIVNMVLEMILSC